MNARLERELGTLAKHVEALEQLANETDRDASFARRARGAAGAAAAARRNLATQLEAAERAAAEAAWRETTLSLDSELGRIWV